MPRNRKGIFIEKTLSLAERVRLIELNCTEAKIWKKRGMWRSQAKPRQDLLESGPMKLLTWLPMMLSR